LLAIPSVGNSPPKISLTNLNGKIINFPNSENNITILTFFASWSKSCDEEIKVLNRIYHEYKNSGLKIFAISFDRKFDTLEKFVKDENIEFEILIDKNLVSINKYAILILPTTFVIDKEGNIASIFVDFDDKLEITLKNFIDSQLDK